MRATDELRRLLDEFEHECFMLRVEASETRAKNDVVRTAYECIRDDFAERIVAKLGSEVNGETSDGYHTFDELYHHRAVLFSVIVRDHRDKAWKARKHHDGTMYDGMFIVGIETPGGQATYHYDLDPYWDMFDCEEREFAPEWDGHTPEEAIARIGRLATLGYGLNPDGLPAGLTISDDGALLNWRGENYVRQFGGTLTAEQVRKAIFDGSTYASYDGVQYYANGINIQAIADELNTELESEPPQAVYIVESYDSLTEGGYVEPTCYRTKQAAIRLAKSLTYDDGGGVRYWAHWKELKVVDE